MHLKAIFIAFLRYLTPEILMQPEQSHPWYPSTQHAFLGQKQQQYKNHLKLTYAKILPRRRNGRSFFFLLHTKLTTSGMCLSMYVKGFKVNSN